MTAMQEINGDIRLSAGDRLRYLWRNGKCWLGSVGRGPRTHAFAPGWTRCEPLYVGQSPSRLVTEAFFETLPSRFATRPIEVLEVGCGSGSMARRLARLGYSGRYTGVDVGDRFEKIAPDDFPFERHFQQIDAHEFVPDHPLDLVVSVSALEHIPRDDALIRRIDGFMAPGGMQLHVVPAGAALPIYLWHGWRQYTPVMLADRFGGARTEIHAIGGCASFLLHLVALTPEIAFGKLVRGRLPGVYKALMKGALSLDRMLPFAPAAFAVIKRY